MKTIGRTGRASRTALAPAVVAGILCVLMPDTIAGQASFQLQEATIADVHRAIQEGEITCRGSVHAYFDRVQAYNGVSDRLVTRDGAPIVPATGAVRAGSPIRFPTETVSVSTLLPDFDQYRGTPIELL